jgi:hypothetical protein
VVLSTETSHFTLYKIKMSEAIKAPTRTSPKVLAPDDVLNTSTATSYASTCRHTTSHRFVGARRRGTRFHPRRPCKRVAMTSMCQDYLNLLRCKDRHDRYAPTRCSNCFLSNFPISLSAIFRGMAADLIRFLSPFSRFRRDDLVCVLCSRLVIRISPVKVFSSVNRTHIEVRLRESYMKSL